MQRRDFIKTILGGSVISMSSACVQKNIRYSPIYADKYFIRYIKDHGHEVKTLTVTEMVDFVLSYYQEQRFDGLAKMPDADMLLYQWGIYDWGKGENFEIDITRQFILHGTQGFDVAYQLRATANFRPTDELRNFSAANKWCQTPAQLEEFKNYIHESMPYQRLRYENPDSIIIQCFRV